MNGLIGYTGFVGSNIARQHKFDSLYNSKNVHKIRGKQFKILVCSGIPSEMWIANSSPEEDLKQINSLISLIKTTQCDQLILISTIAVYKNPVDGVDEDSFNKFEDTLPYGKNRRKAEIELHNHFGDRLVIVRLPGIFGKGVKKNLIYDIINRCPRFISKKKFSELQKSSFSSLLSKSYFLNSRDMYEYKRGDNNEQVNQLIDYFEVNQFTSLSFTHSKSIFQFYCLDNIWKDISMAISNNIKTINICSEPISAEEVVKALLGFKFQNDNNQKPLNYNMKSKYFELWGQKSSYLYSKSQVIEELIKFVNSEIKNETVRI